MSDENPYESPKHPSEIVAPLPIDASLEPRIGNTAMFLLAIVTGFLCLFVPPVAVLLLLLIPAALRYVRLRNIRARRGQSLSQSEAMKLFAACAVIAIPIMLASVTAFCCVCMSGAAIGSQIFIGKGGANDGGMMIGGGLLLIACSYLALMLGQVLLRRFNYLSKEETVPPAENA